MTWLEHTIPFFFCFFPHSSFTPSACPWVSDLAWALDLVLCLTVKQSRVDVCAEDRMVSWVQVTCLWCMTSYNPNNESIIVNYTCLDPTAISSPLCFAVWLESPLLFQPPPPLPSHRSLPVYSFSVIISLVFLLLPLLLSVALSFSLFLLFLFSLSSSHPHPFPFHSVLVHRVSWWSFV